MAQVFILGAGTPTPTQTRIGDVRKIYDGEIIFAEELISLRVCPGRRETPMPRNRADVRERQCHPGDQRRMQNHVP